MSPRYFPGYDSRPPTPADWSLYGACARCGARAAEPCRDLRWRRGASSTEVTRTFKPHDGRPLL